MLDININSLIGSTIKYLNQSYILGDQDITPISLMSVLLQYIDYTKEQIEAGNEEYKEKLKYLEDLLEQLKKCNSICNYKKKVVYLPNNTAPQIEDNILTYCFDEKCQTLPIEEVVNNYQDNERDSLCTIGLLSIEGLNLIINGDPGEINSEYEPDSDFIVCPSLDESKVYLIKNIPGDCKSVIVCLNKEELETLIEAGGKIIDIQENGTVIIQTIKNQVVLGSDISYFENTTLTGEVVTFSGTFSIKVEDDHPINPLYSQEATITVNFEGCCEEVPLCEDVTNISLTHGENYTVNWETDISSDPNIDSVLITEMPVDSGFFVYNNAIIIPGILPVILDKEQIEAGALVYYPDPTINDEFIWSFSFQTAFEESYNFCTNFSEVIITKLEKENVPPTVEIESIDCLLVSDETDTANTIINSTIDYTGTGSYTIEWNIVTLQLGIVLTNTTQESVSISNLPVGNHIFCVTVTTDEDGFIVKEYITVCVEVEKKPPIVDAGRDKEITLPITNSSANGTTSDVDGTIVSVVWTQLSGPNTAGISNGNTLNPQFNSLSLPGVYVFQITVTDNDGNTATDIMTITVIEVVEPESHVTSPTEISEAECSLQVCFNVVGTPNTIVSWTIDVLGTNYVTNQSNNMYNYSTGSLDLGLSGEACVPFIVQPDMTVSGLGSVTVVFTINNGSATQITKSFGEINSNSPCPV